MGSFEPVVIGVAWKYLSYMLQIFRVYFNAAGGNRTLVTGLENPRNGRYTTAALYIYMGNIYNVEQKSVPTEVAGTNNASKTGLEEWSREARKQVMEKLKSYAPEKVDQIIKATFGDLGYAQRS